MEEVSSKVQNATNCTLPSWAHLSASSISMMTELGQKHVNGCNVALIDDCICQAASLLEVHGNVARRYSLQSPESMAETIAAADAQQYSQSLLDRAKGVEQLPAQSCV